MTNFIKGFIEHLENIQHSIGSWDGHGCLTEGCRMLPQEPDEYCPECAIDRAEGIYGE